MPRPTTKQTLITAANDGFVKLWKLIDSMPEEVQNAIFAFDDRDKNLRDVLVHLYEWHRLLLNWVRSNVAGKAVNFLPDPYNWKTYPQMNIAFWEKYQRLDTPLGESKTMLRGSHAEVLAEIEKFSGEELFPKQHFPWTGTTSLGSYCVSATSSHYDWAIKKLKQHIKSR
jgi:hypothetical protein